MVSLYCQLMEELGLKGAQVLLTRALRSRLLHQYTAPLSDCWSLEWCRSSMKTTPSLRMIGAEGGLWRQRQVVCLDTRDWKPISGLLTDVEGVYAGPPDKPDSVFCPCMTSRLPWRLVKRLGGRGGMAWSDAAQVATTAGVAIANGTLPGVVSSVLQGEDVGTFFLIGFQQPQALAGLATSCKGRIW